MRISTVNRFAFATLWFITTTFVSISCHSRQKADHTSLIYWSSNNQYEIEFARAVVQEWNALHPDKPVIHQPVPEGQSSEEVILAAVVGKTTPDIYSNMWQGDVEVYARAKVLVAFDTLPGFIPFIYQRCDSSVVEEVRSSDGHIYQFPWKINPIMMIYNRRHFREIGLKNPPATYSEYLRAARKIQRDIDGDGYVDRWIGYLDVNVTWWRRLFDFYPLYLAASRGGHLVQNNRAAFNNSYAVEVFAFLRTLYEKNYFPRESLAARQDPFLAGVITTRFTGPWEIMHAERFKPPGFEYSFAPLPVPDSLSGPIYTYGDPKNIVIFNTCRNPRVAWQFIQFMVSKQGDLQFLKMTQQLPRRKDLWTDPQFREFFRQHPKLEPFARQARYVIGTDPCPVLKEVFEVISQEYEACVIYGKKTPRKAVEDAARAVNVLLE